MREVVLTQQRAGLDVDVCAVLVAIQKLKRLVDFPQTNGSERGGRREQSAVFVFVKPPTA